MGTIGAATTRAQRDRHNADIRADTAPWSDLRKAMKRDVRLNARRMTAKGRGQRGQRLRREKRGRLPMHGERIRRRGVRQESGSSVAEYDTSRGVSVSVKKRGDIRIGVLPHQPAADNGSRAAGCGHGKSADVVCRNFKPCEQLLRQPLKQPFEPRKPALSERREDERDCPLAQQARHRGGVKRIKPARARDVTDVRAALSIDGHAAVWHECQGFHGVTSPRSSIGTRLRIAPGTTPRAPRRA